LGLHDGKNIEEASTPSLLLIRRVVLGSTGSQDHWESLSPTHSRTPKKVPEQPFWLAVKSPSPTVT
jgi:hypothetical protein